jgi:alanine dehydrogenase
LLFTFLHLAADAGLTRALLERGVTAPALIAAVAIVSGVLMGLVVGAITGAALVWLTRRPVLASQSVERPTFL